MTNFALAYGAMIQDIVDAVGMSSSMLHVHCGMAIYLAGRLVLQGPRAPVLALSAVAGAEAFNEVMDRLQHGSWRWPDTSWDIVLTLFWPAMCFAAGRLIARRRNGR